MGGDDLLLTGWVYEMTPGEDDPIYPFIEEGDIFAQWVLGDRASDFVLLVGLTLGEDDRKAMFNVLDEISEAAIHIHAKQLNRADFFVRLRGDKLFEKRCQFVGPEVREMIEAAATGEHI